MPLLVCAASPGLGKEQWCASSWLLLHLPVYCTLWVGGVGGTKQVV
jgi:hypothetical protein